MPALSRITLFPVKSLDGHTVDRASILPSGALENDRRFALVDSWGKYINGKLYPEIHRIRARYSDDLKHIHVSHENSERTFSLENEAQAFADWCGDVLQRKCSVIVNNSGGFPDDSESPGPTLISTATLKKIASWFDEVDLEECRRKFRMNFEIDSDVAFWEDRLVTPNKNQVLRFQIGDITWQGRNSCQRCIVPTRNSLTGDSTPSFAKTFAKYRKDSIPEWAPLECFDHYYRLGINTALDTVSTNNTVAIGDSLTFTSDTMSH